METTACWIQDTKQEDCVDDVPVTAARWSAAWDCREDKRPSCWSDESSTRRRTFANDADYWKVISRKGIKIVQMLASVGFTL